MAEREQTPGEEGRPLIVGRIGGPWGVKGWVRVRSYTASPPDLLEYRPWYLQVAGRWQAAEVLEGRVHGKGLVARLAGCADRDAAERLAGSDIGIYRDQLPATGEGEYYWNDLIGLRVQTTGGTVLGQVDHLLETGANDVLVVTGERERLVPFIRAQVIVDVDLEGGVITVDWDPDD